jgi:hypothetical protein
MRVDRVSCRLIEIWFSMIICFFVSLFKIFSKGLENVEILDRFGERMWKIGQG